MIGHYNNLEIALSQENVNTVPLVNAILQVM